MTKEKKMTKEEFVRWCGKSEVGSRHVYFVGHNCKGSPLASAAWRAMCEGQITLFQRRLAPFKFEYIAVRISTRSGKKLAIDKDWPKGKI